MTYSARSQFVTERGWGRNSRQALKAATRGVMLASSLPGLFPGSHLALFLSISEPPPRVGAAYSGLGSLHQLQ